jgi:hypothetical protein
MSFSGGDKPSGNVGDATITFEPLDGPAGGHTTVKNAMFGFAPEYRVGRAPGLRLVRAGLRRRIR